jgi:RNA polymerase sigma factor (sigma-70 family)
MITNMMSVAANNDAELVSGTLAGNRDAFGQIVSRYQSLICSLAYSATGSLGQSEDLAQETFITAWKHLSHLREREKLRAWLCGIARNRINNFLRREGREPIREAEPLENLADSRSTEPLPVEQTISNEEAAILWRSLEKIPEIYREPLVLFYREQQSIETVAENLELTEDAVKQRLSRGRKLLQEEVLAFVEGALTRTNPGKIFTLGVLAALPAAFATSTKAATLGTASVKGGATAKAAGTLGLLGVILGPVMILFGNYIPYRMGLAEARTDVERSHIKSFYRRVVGWSLGLSVTAMGLLWWLFRHQYTEPLHPLDVFMTWFICFTVAYLLVMFGSAIVTSGKKRAIYTNIITEEHGGRPPKAAFEYCCRIRFLGLPLINIRIGDRFDLLRKPIVGWVACGNYAVGGLLAFGAVAVAPVAIGGLVFGLIPFGGIAIGIFPLGGIALGVWAFGGVAIGWQAMGGFALAWHAAVGNLAVARDFAVGSIVHALQANTDFATQFTDSNLYFRCMKAINRHWFWMNFLWITPLLVQWQIIARRRRQEAKKS